MPVKVSLALDAHLADRQVQWHAAAVLAQPFDVAARSDDMRHARRAVPAQILVVLLALGDAISMDTFCPTTS